MDKERRFPLVLSSFWLKVIALLTMTIDHIGFAFDIEPMRIIGRLALPLFCFMIAEGAIHTRSFKKYALRLGIMASVISLAILLSEYVPFLKNNGFSMRNDGVIFIDLLLGAVAVYLLRQKKWYIKLLALLPLAYGIASYIASSYECVGCGHTVYWFPFFMRMQYGWYGILLIAGFYAAHLLANVFISYLSSLNGIDKELYKGSNLERHSINIISVLVLAVVTLGYYLCESFVADVWGTMSLFQIQLYAIISGAFILLYNGMRGYNKKWFQYGSYIYYPLHMIVIGIIQMFI